jgi:hypothetical protein
MRRAGLLEESNDSEGLAFGVGVASGIIGPMGTKKRFEWMYVDIKKNKEGRWAVSSPLKLDHENVSISFKGVKDTIRFVEVEIDFLQDPRLDEYRTNVLEWFKKYDADFPKTPKW